ncbi:hypothetical protein Q7P37_002920 [Cladosporium fusiforme]
MSSDMPTHDDYTIAWICPLRFELLAALAMLDERSSEFPSQAEGDDNIYFLGSINGHKIVVASSPVPSQRAVRSAFPVFSSLRKTFPALKAVALIGIGGGAPTTTVEGPLRLGHVVVSKESLGKSGVYRHDHQQGRDGAIVRVGTLREPPRIFAQAIERFAVARFLAEADPLAVNIERVTTKPKLQDYRHPGAEYDRLYKPDYPHAADGVSCQYCCNKDELARALPVLDGEDDAKGDPEVVVHEGVIAVGDWDIEALDGEVRDRLAGENNILCFESEAVSMATDIPTLIIRGIVDYADSHRNQKWHKYGAAAAAAYARQLFFSLSVDEVREYEVKVHQETVTISGSRVY